MRNIGKQIVPIGIAWLCAIAHARQATADEFPFWIAGSDGVEWCSLDSETGQLKKLKRVSDHSLTWLATRGDRFLYGGSVLKDAVDAMAGALSAFRINPDQSLSFLNQVPSSGKPRSTLPAIPPDEPCSRSTFAKTPTPVAAASKAAASRTDNSPPIRMRSCSAQIRICDTFSG